MAEPGFSFASREAVVALLKNGTNMPQWKSDMIDQSLVTVSARLSAWYPTLKDRWLNADSEDPIVDFVTAIVVEAVKKYVDNPDGMSSETMGPYAYSRFDSQDVVKNLFNERDLKALEGLLSDSQVARGAARIKFTNTYPASPMPRPGRYTNSRKWPRGRTGWRDSGVW